MIEHWPVEVPLPGSNQLGDHNKGIMGLNIEHLSLLYNAVRSEDHQLGIRKIAEAAEPACSMVNIGDSVLTTAFSLFPSSAVPSGSNGGSNLSHKRAHEEDSKGNVRTGKRLHVMGDQHGVV